MTEPFVRNNFFDGKLLTAADLELEQNYFRSKLKLHNQLLHGFGIVSGLEVKVSSRGSKLLITPGLALDCTGNEVLVQNPVEHPLPGTNFAPSVFLTIHYQETKKDLIPLPELDEACRHGHIAEGFGLTFESNNPHQGHRHLRGRWQPCGQLHGLTIARLKKSEGQWRLDRRLHRAIVR